MPTVSVIVLNHNGARLLEEALQSLLLLDFDSFEVLVVDNASSDNSVQLAEEAGVRVVRAQENLGFSRGNNLGALESKGKYLLFVNNDMRFDPSLLARMVATIENDDGIFAVDCRQMDWDGTKVIHGSRRFAPGSPIESFWPFVREIQDYSIVGPVDTPWGCGSNLLVRKEMFDELGGFDPTFFLDYEDLDLCWRAWMRGWRTVFIGTTHTFHAVGRGSENVEGKVPHWRRISGEMNTQRFFLKTMPRKVLIQVAFGRVMRLLGFLMLLRSSETAIMLKGLFETLRSWRDILDARVEVLADSYVSATELISRFSV